jgi:hypothetical protein
VNFRLSVVHIGTTKQLLFDDFIVESLDGVHRVPP